jgi:superfamily II DNA or RNA helicase
MDVYIDDKFIVLKSFTQDEKALLRKRFTYDDKSNVFAGGKFDSRKIKKVCLVKFSKGYAFMFSGFLKEFLEFAKENLKIDSVEDKRTKKSFQKKEIPTRQFFPEHFSHTEHQEQALAKMLKTNVGIIKSPTSSGKTETFIAYLKATKMKTLILMDRVSLVEQTRDRIEKAGFKNVGVAHGDRVEDGDIVVATVYSVRKLPSLTKFKCLIIDECFPGNTRVSTENGKKKISTLVRNKSTEKVWSFNEKTKEFELKPIYNWYEKKHYDNLIKICFSNGSNVKSTKNHEYYIFKNGLIYKKRADMLDNGDRIIFKPTYFTKSGSSVPPVISNKQYKLLNKDKHKAESFIIDDKNSFGLREVKHVEEVEPNYNTVYNISVEGNHNYLVNSGYLVTNCHKSSADTFQDFLYNTSFPFRFGFSATPNPGDKFKWAKIRQYLGDIIYEIDPEELMEKKVLAKPKIHFLKSQGSPTPDWHSAYEICISKNSSRNTQIMDLVEKYDTSTLILVKHIDHGKYLEENIDGALFLSGVNSGEERQEAIQRFEEGELKVIIATSIFNEGISINAIRLLIIASGGKSKVETVQRLGRGLRTDPKTGKYNVLVYDFLDKGNKFTLRHSKERAKIYKKEGFDVVLPS